MLEVPGRGTSPGAQGRRGQRPWLGSSASVPCDVSQDAAEKGLLCGWLRPLPFGSLGNLFINTSNCFSLNSRVTENLQEPCPQGRGQGSGPVGSGPCERDQASKNHPRSVGSGPWTQADSHRLAFCLDHHEGLNVCVPQIPAWESEPSVMVWEGEPAGGDQAWREGGAPAVGSVPL